METDGCWILEIFGTQVTNKKRQLCPSFPGKLSIFFGYDMTTSKTRPLCNVSKVEATFHVQIFIGLKTCRSRILSYSLL